MKKQKLNKKLELNKNTVANLGTEDMDDVKGGTYPSLPTCHIPSLCKPCTIEITACLGCID